jgi:hypothetical protein
MKSKAIDPSSTTSRLHRRSNGTLLQSCRLHQAEVVPLEMLSDPCRVVYSSMSPILCEAATHHTRFSVAFLDAKKEVSLFSQPFMPPSSYFL